MCLCKKDFRFEESSVEEYPLLELGDVDKGDVGNVSEERDTITQFLNWFFAEDGQLTEVEAVRNDVVDFVTGQSNLEHSEVVEEVKLVILSTIRQNQCWILS